METFFSESKGAPQDSTSCEALEGTWNEEMGICLTPDIVTCMGDGGGESGPPECNSTLTNDCFQYNNTSKEVCETYYWEAFDGQGNYDVRNCRYWDGTCGVEGSYGQASTACTGGSCGNNICEAGLGENSSTCKQDCGTGGGYTCPNGICESWAGENNSNCPADCGGSGYTCPNGICESWAGENNSNCPA
ncbi:MAG TPA: hypothetical protein PKW68_01070, partial [bacterium]|nr:hypothetical protein [bacterium]